MTSSEVPQPKKRRLRLWLAVLLVIAAAGYSAGWYFLARKVEERVDQAIARLAERGVTADCANRAISGFPLRMAVLCDEIDYADDERQIFINTNGGEAAVAVWNPTEAAVRVIGPLLLDSPDVPPLTVDWDALTAKVGIGRPTPSSIAIDARGLSGQRDPEDETQPRQVFQAAHLTALLRPLGKDLAWTGTFTDLKIDPEVVEGRNIPPLAGQGDATITGGAVLLRDRPRSVRGQAIVINNLALSAGEGSVTVSGPLSVDKDGLIDADLKIGIKNPQAVGQALQTAMPERASEINTAVMGMAFLGKQPSVPLKVSKGRATLMGFKLAEIPALR